MTHEIIKELNEFKEQFKTKAQKTLKEEFKHFFAKFPNIKSIMWAQYTPYFNDGDACLFGLREFEFKGALDEAGSFCTRERNYEYGSDCVRDNVRHGGTKKPEQIEFINEATHLVRLCNDLEDMMKDIFGDHVLVEATIDGFDIEDFEHD